MRYVLLLLFFRWRNWGSVSWISHWVHMLVSSRTGIGTRILTQSSLFLLCRWFYIINFCYNNSIYFIILICGLWWPAQPLSEVHSQEANTAFKLLFLLVFTFMFLWASLVAQLVKNLPAMQETQIRSLGREDPLEKEMATHSSIVAWRIPWTEEPGGLKSRRSQRIRNDWVTNFTFHISLFFFLMCSLTLITLCL